MTKSRIGYVLGLLGAALLVVVVDRLGTSEDSAMVSMVVLLATSAALGWTVPRRAWVTGLVIGSALGLAALVYLAADPTRVPRPGGFAGAATMFVLAVPALAAAYGGAWLRRSEDPTRPAGSGA